MEILMSKTILMDVDGFTPVIDGLLLDTDLITAAVFGVMWRFCQMESGECYASVQRIADRLGLSYKTVQRRIDILGGKGYLEDVTPHLRYSPHTYRDTGKASMRSSTVANVDGILDQNHPHNGYKSRNMQETLGNVADDLIDQGELTEKRYNRLEDKLNPTPIPKEKTNWNDQVALIQAGRSQSPTG
jgi:DNA-binding Lrp family transcriptional regulator